MYHQPDVILYVGIIYYFANHLRDIMVYITTKPTNNMDYLYIYIDQLLVCGKHAGDQESRAECNQIYIYILGHRIYIRIICPDIRYNIVSYIHIIYPERYISPNILVNYNDPTVLPHWNHGL